MTPLAANLTQFGKLCGVGRKKVQAWIREGMPFIPESRKNKLIIVSVGLDWLKGRMVTIK